MQPGSRFPTSQSFRELHEVALANYSQLYRLQTAASKSKRILSILEWWIHLKIEAIRIGDVISDKKRWWRANFQSGNRRLAASQLLCSLPVEMWQMCKADSR